MRRLQRINNCSDSKRLDALISWELREKEPKTGNTPFERVAAACGLTGRQYAIGHTFLPARCVRAGQYSNGSKEFPWHAMAIGTHASIAPLKAYNFCEKCHQEDLSLYGIWHASRKHQIVGAEFCTSHGTPLHQADELPDSPSLDFRHLRQTSCTLQRASSSERAAIEAYLSLYQQLLSGDRVEWAHALRTALIQLCEQAFGKVEKHGTWNRNLTQSIAATFPRAWLVEVLPTFHKWRAGADFLPMQALFSARSQPSTTAFLISIVSLLEGNRFDFSTLENSENETANPAFLPESETASRRCVISSCV